MNLREFATKSPWYSALFTALGFALASILGLLVAGILLRSGLSDWILDWAGQYQAIQRLLIAIVLFILGLSLSGAVMGGIGGWLLSLVDPLAPRRRYIWAGAIGYAISQAVVITVALLLVGFLALYHNNMDTQPAHLPLLFALIGLLYGVLSGLLFGFLSVGFKYGWGVLLASMLGGFFGGALVGFLVERAVAIVGAGGAYSRPWLIVLICLAFFGVMGALLGLLYAWFDRKREAGALPQKMGKIWTVVVLVAAVWLFLNIAGVFSQIYSFATMRDASTSTSIPSKTTGVAWSAPDTVPQSENTGSPVIDIAAGLDGQLAIAWSLMQDSASDVVLSLSGAGGDDQTVWLPPLNVSSSAEPSSDPQVAVDSNGNWHVVWTEADAKILYARCSGADCTAPLALSATEAPACAAGGAQNQGRATISVDESDQIMVAWQSGDGDLLYNTWQASGAPTAAPDCVPVIGQGWQPQLVGAESGQFTLAYDTASEGQSGDVIVLQYQNSGWDSAPLLQEAGYAPVLYRDELGQAHAAWCGNDDLVRYQALDAQGAPEQIDFPSCSERPALSEDGYGRMHLIWRANEIVNNYNVASEGNFLYESVRLADEWSEPALIVRPGESAAPVVVTDETDALHAAWADASSGILHVVQPYYTCDDTTGSYLGDAILEVATSGKYRPAEEKIPFCQNEFMNFLHLPTSNPEFTDKPSTQYGGFDDVAEQIDNANFEVLFATMEWMKDENQDSPGMLFAEAVTDLYEKVKANPDNYPKGVTVRVLLGNYPEIATFSWGEQVWNVMDVFQKAGLPEMENAELGWKVELANYDGQIPHSHTKFVIVDGEIVTASGFNYSYLHLPETHPSGQGVSLVDLGLEMQGPVAQQALVEYDDLWEGSDQVLCPDLNPPEGDWAKHCDFGVAEATHVPEALRFHPTGGDSFAFSLLRTSHHPESDDALDAVIRSAQDTIDIFEVSFSLELYCTLGVVMEGFCSMDDALRYTHALIDVMEENGVKIRVLVTDVNMNGMENSVALDVLREELDRRGIRDQVEARYYVGRMHSKAFLTDEKLLVVGSQNFHYSAWGDDRGLAEYNLATNDPAAIEEFQRTFEYFWDNATPIELAEQLEMQP